MRRQTQTKTSPIANESQLQRDSIVVQASRRRGEATEKIETVRLLKTLPNTRIVEDSPIPSIDIIEVTDAEFWHFSHCSAFSTAPQ